MANHTITVSNALNLNGGGPPTLWGSSGATTMTWGTDYWGSGSEDMVQVITKLIEDALTASSAISQTILEIRAGIANTLTITTAISADVLTNGIWSYVWRGGVTDHVSEISTTYTAPAAASSTYTTPSTPATTWS